MIDDAGQADDDTDVDEISEDELRDALEEKLREILDE